jgi:protoporphyrin/coproporphyrin ferrochelatase
MVSMPAYDALLLVSFGGPEGPEDVLPFLRNVTAGRNIPDSRLEQVAEHYYLFGGISPINQQCRDLVAAIEKDFEAGGIDLPVYWGNRNWQPYLAGTVATMAADGVTRALAVATSAYSSYSSCRQYLEDIEHGRAPLGSAAPRIDKIPPYFSQAGFTQSFATAAEAALQSLPADVRDQADLVFTAHSIPLAMSERSGPLSGAYPAQLAEVAGQVAARLGVTRPWRLAYSSRSGPPAQPWLEPDISDCLAELAAAGSRAVVVVPIGFVSDHMEVRFDLDVEAAETARRLGLPFARATTPGTSAPFVAMITDLVRQWQAEPPASGPPGVTAAAAAPAGHGAAAARRFCGSDCCVPAPARPLAAR